MENIIPLFGMLIGVIIPVSVFYWQYKEGKEKNKTIIEISKNIDDSSKLEELLAIFDERKKEPIDYRRNGVITIFVGIGLYLLGILCNWKYPKRRWSFGWINRSRDNDCRLPLSKYW